MKHHLSIKTKPTTSPCAGADKTIALAGNPNVGKSTVFNALTGMNQHTGNWPGKTVASAQGTYRYKEQEYTLVDLPGTYSLMAHSAEEEIARDFLVFGNPDAVVVVCDATCLERNLNLVLQTAEITPNLVVCVNLLDEAKKKHIKIDLKKLETLLGVPVVGTSARSKRGLDALTQAVATLPEYRESHTCIQVQYSKIIEDAISILTPAIETETGGVLNTRFIALKLLDGNATLIHSIEDALGFPLSSRIADQLEEARKFLADRFMTPTVFSDALSTAPVQLAERIFAKCAATPANCNSRDRKLDKIFTSRLTGIPVMLLLLGLIFFITITGANYPSDLLFNGFARLGDLLTNWFHSINAPEMLISILMDGVYRVLTWVIAVMLPPMAIFFPLFTLLEDAGYLPRVAFNLDKQFQKAGACGKQSLTMCMGFGCNAAGVTGCRIIDSPRERLIAILTNNFVPCNGRFPTIISIMTMFFIGAVAFPLSSVLSTLLLLLVIVFGVVMTLLVSKLLSKTILKGVPSSFTLELPPYRRPQFLKVIVRSIFDRTLFVLARAVAVAAPAGLIIWLTANIYIGDTSILTHLTQFLDPIAAVFGLDGVILMAFILGFPANEIVVPIMLMGYLATGSIVQMDDLTQLHTLLVNNGWTWLTALNVVLFSLIHFPCSTTVLTIKKETGSWKWTLASIVIPTVMGLLLCFLTATAAKLFL